MSCMKIRSFEEFTKNLLWNPPITFSVMFQRIFKYLVNNYYRLDSRQDSCKDIVKNLSRTLMEIFQASLPGIHKYFTGNFPRIQSYYIKFQLNLLNIFRQKFTKDLTKIGFKCEQNLPQVFPKIQCLFYSISKKEPTLSTITKSYCQS